MTTWPFINYKLLGIQSPQALSINDDSIDKVLKDKACPLFASPKHQQYNRESLALFFQELCTMFIIIVGSIYIVNHH